MTPPDRDEVVTIVAMLGIRPDGQVSERIRSVELAWLISEIEQRYQVTLPLTDADLTRMGTVSGAVTVLRHALTKEGDR